MTQVSKGERFLKKGKGITGVDDLGGGSKDYWYQIEARDESGRYVRYHKQIAQDGKTLRVYQEEFDATGRKVAEHQKYPIDTGHIRIREIS